MSFEAAKDLLLREATRRGVDAEVLATSQRDLKLTAHDGRVDDITQSTRGGVGVRVVSDGRVGYASSEALDAASLGWMLDEAIENAAMQADRGAVLPAGGPLGRHDLIGEGLSAPVEEKAEAVIAMERGLSSDPRVDALQLAQYAESEVEASLASTRGVSGGYRTGYTLLVASPIMKRDGSVKQGWDIDLSKEFHSLDPSRTAHAVLERVGRHLGATPLRTGRYPALFEPEVTAEVLHLLSVSLSGKMVAEGKSRLAARLGEQVASSCVTLLDDPTLPFGFGSRPFDAEGTPARPTVLIESGVLRGFLHNSDTARRTGQENSGHAERTYASPLGVGISNLMLAPGDGASLDDGVVVTDLAGVHAGANPITGDVSVQGHGLLVVGGEARPVENFALSFNLFDLLEGIECVGDALVWRPAGGGLIGSRSLRVGSLSFAGA